MWEPPNLPGLLIGLLLSISIGSFGSFAASAAPWPGGSGTEIGNVGSPGGLPAGYEPSGAVWHSRLETLFVVGDEGVVSQMDFDGQNVTTWLPGGDLEAVTVADPQSDLIYLGVESPDSVLEFNVASGTLTGNGWDLTTWMTGPAGSGLEALTFVNGLFYAGLQDDGGIYVFHLQPGGVVSFIKTIANPTERTDLSGLHYESATERLYAVHDSSDVLVEMDADGNFVREFDLPADKQEGIAIVPACADGLARAYVSDDAMAVWRYDSYPVECIAPSAVPALAPLSIEGLFALLIGTGVAAARISDRLV